MPARKTRFRNSFADVEQTIGPIEVCLFNAGSNVNKPLLDTTEKLFFKAWELACYAGFLVGREAARHMLTRGRGTILFTGATASIRGGKGFAAFSSAKFGLRAVAQAMARELGPKNIHVVHLLIDAGVDSEEIHRRYKAQRGIDATRHPAGQPDQDRVDRRGLLVRPSAEPGTAGPTSSIFALRGEMVTWPTAPDLTLWGVGTIRTIRPHWAMHELGLTYKSKPIGPRTGETKTAEYTSAQSAAEDPAAAGRRFHIGESAAIVAYLSRTYSTPERSLIPEAPREYAAWLEWCFFIVAELDSTSLYVMRRHRADALGPIYGDRARGRRQGRRIFSRAVAPCRGGAGGWPPVPDGRPVHQRRHPADHLPGPGPSTYGVGICDNAQPYLEGIRKRPAYQLAKAANVALAPIVPVLPKE